MNSRDNNFTAFTTIVDKYETYIFDCDGVLWSGKTKFEEAFKTLDYLKSKRKNIFFITNGSAKSREALYKKIKGLSFDCRLEHAYPTSYLASAYLKLHDPNIKSIYVVGRDGIVDEARKVGLEVYGGPDDDDKILNSEEDFLKMPILNVDAVVVGLDMHFNFYKLSHACACIERGAKFYATNDDAFDKIGDRKLPAAGGIVDFIQKVTGVKAIVLGKPNKYAIDVLVEEHNLEREKCIMIGDRLDTDILLGINSGIDSCLVMTGATTDEVVKKELQKSDPVVPTYICKDLAL
jgi:phosphoglycolate/pyridoxal phosphate phosphatase family enzyme